MLWFSVWTVLVVGTLVGAFFLARRLYRSGKALVVELTRAADVLGQVAERAEQLAPAATQPVPVDLADLDGARARREESRAATERRRLARARRHEAAYLRWQQLSR